MGEFGNKRSQDQQFPQLDTVIDEELSVDMIRANKLQYPENEGIHDRTYIQLSTIRTSFSDIWLEIHEENKICTRHRYPSLQRGASPPVTKRKR